MINVVSTRSFNVPYCEVYLSVPLPTCPYHHECSDCVCCLLLWHPVHKRSMHSSLVALVLCYVLLKCFVGL